MNVLAPDYQPQPRPAAPASAKPRSKPGYAAFDDYIVSRPETIWSRMSSASPTTPAAKTRSSVGGPDGYIASQPETIWSHRSTKAPSVPANSRPAIPAPDDYIVSRPKTIWSAPATQSPQPAGAPSGTTSGTGAKGGKHIAMWDGGKFDFYDVLDVINPLQHIPIISTIYRENTGDQIGAVPRVLGSILYGFGPIGAIVGAASAVIDLAVEGETGKDIGGHIYTALFGDKKQAPPPPSVAKKSQTSLHTNPQTTPAPTPKKDAQPGLPTMAGGAPIAAPPPPARKTVSNKFRLSEWYKRNHTQLERQARALARARSAQSNPTFPKSGTAKPRNGKPAELVPGATTLQGAKPSEATKPDLLSLFDVPKPTPTKEAAARTGAKASQTQPPPVPGPWIADQMQKALQKYEHLMKSHTTPAPTINKKG